MSAVILPFPKRALPSEEDRSVAALVRRIEAAIEAAFAVPASERDSSQRALTGAIERLTAGG